MGLPYRTVESAFAQLYGVREEKRTAFRARLKHFQRLGFPPGINTGTGRAAEYQGEHIYMLAVALEMLQLGLSPERIVALMTNYRPYIAAAIGSAINSVWSDEPEAQGRIDFLLFDPSALSGLLSDQSDDPGDSIIYCTQDKLADEITRLTSDASQRVSVINLTDLIARTTPEISDEEQLQNYLQSVADWAIELVRNAGMEWVPHGNT